MNKHQSDSVGTPEYAGFIPPDIRGNEWQYIKDCLYTNRVSSVGPLVGRFEAAMAEYVGAKYAGAASNRIAALHTALLVAAFPVHEYWRDIGQVDDYAQAQEDVSGEKAQP